MIGWTIGGRLDWKSSARKVIHLSSLLALGGLTSEFSWDPEEGFEFKPPLDCSTTQGEL